MNSYLLHCCSADAQCLFTPRPPPSFLLSHFHTAQYSFTKHFCYDYTCMKYNILHDILCGTPDINRMQYVLYCITMKE